jgi:hypothetical protein
MVVGSACASGWAILAILLAAATLLVLRRPAAPSDYALPPVGEFLMRAV